MRHARRKLHCIVLGLALAGLAVSCGDEGSKECEKPADCVGKPAGNFCVKVSGKGHCVVQCQVGADGKDNCPLSYSCTGHADDQSLFCKPQ